MSILSSRLLIWTAAVCSPLILSGCVVATDPYYGRGYQSPGVVYEDPAPAPYAYSPGVVYETPAPAVYAYPGGGYGWRGRYWGR